MADPPKLVVPPPLPEAFRSADTPPSGTPTLIGLQRPALPPLPPPPSSVGAELEAGGPQEMARLIRGLRQDLVLFRDTLPQLLQSVQAAPAVPATPVPPSQRTRARKALAGLIGVSAAAGVTAILTLLGGIAAKRWPAYAELISGVVQALGGGP